MPTIEVSMKSLEKLSGRRLREEDLELAKGKIEEINAGKARIEIGDTNRPDLWCAEGIARVVKGKRFQKLPAKSSGKEIIVDRKILGIRPFISGFAAKNIMVDEELLLDMIQLQDKLGENFGKKRKKISVGIYNYDMIKFPVHYKAVNPSHRFVPLGFDKPATLKDILSEHPKGRDYGYILQNHKLYPLLVDLKDEVLSFPPIINSNYLGKVSAGLRNVMVEVTGTEQKSVLLAANIFAYSLFERGAHIESITSRYPVATKFGKSVQSPYDFSEKMSFGRQKIRDILGIDLKEHEIKSLLERMQYGVSFSGNAVNVAIPPYRNDIMHHADVIEDIAIAYGYENFNELGIDSFTAGSLKGATIFSEKSRRIMTGLGFQEIMSAILSSKNCVCEKMNAESSPIEIENAMSENYSCIRNWVLPNILQCLSKNMHVEFPQKIFELGECVLTDRKSDDGTSTITKMAGAISGNDAGYEDISSCADAFLDGLGFKYRIKTSCHPSFIEGRCGGIYVKEKLAGVVGEVHPKVLNNWRIEKPVAAFEADISFLMKAATSQA